MLDHPIVIFIIIVAALLRWFAQRSGQANSNQPQSSDEPIPRGGETQSEEERIRRFLEALGQPTTSAPPPKVATRRSEIPKRVVKPQVPRASFPLPPLTTAPPPLVTTPPPVPSFSPSSVQMFPPPAPPVAPEPTKPAPLERGFEVRDLSSQTATDPAWSDQAPAADRRKFLLNLASTQDLRRAIILREIFGPPRSLQAIDLLSGF